MPKDLSPKPEYADPKGCLARVVWMMFGFVALFGLSLTIARVPPWTPSWRDLAFWSVVAVTIYARYLDVAKLGGETVNGVPATMGHVRRYAGMVGALALASWAAAHSVEL